MPHFFRRRLVLVITRRFSERIVIGDSIVIQIVGIDRDKVRLGFEAPRDVPVYREELLQPGHPMARPDRPTTSPAD
jgi:carbon storage regulator